MTQNRDAQAAPCIPRARSIRVAHGAVGSARPAMPRRYADLAEHGDTAEDAEEADGLCACACACVCARARERVFVQVGACLSASACACARMRVRARVCARAYVYLCACVCVPALVRARVLARL